MVDYVAQIAALRQQIAAQEQRVTYHTGQVAAEQNSVAAWQAAGNMYEVGRHTAAIQENQGFVADARRQIEQLQKQLDETLAAKANYDRSIAEATAKGLTGAAAEKYAQQTLERSAVINKVILGVAILLGIAAFAYGVTMFIRWKRSKK